MKITRMTKDDLSQVVLLHLLTLPSTTSSKMGKEFVYTLYHHVVSSPRVHSSFVMKDNSRIVGAVTMTRNLRESIKIVSPKVPSHASLVLFMKLITGSVSIGELVNRYRFERMLLSHFRSPYPTILTLFVDPRNRRLGIGKRLLAACIHEAKTKGYKTLYVDTEEMNTSARTFYERLGFSPVTHAFHSIVLTYAFHERA